MPTSIELSGSVFKVDDPTLTFLSSEQKDASSADANVALTKTDLARAHYQLGKLYYDKADLDRAEAAFLKSLTLADTAADAFTILKAYGFLIRISSEKLNLPYAQFL